MRRMILATVCLALIRNGWAEGQSTYKLPPPEVVKILDAPPTPEIVLSPTRDAVLLVDVEGYPPIRELARPILRLAGVRVDPGLGARQRLVRFKGIEIVPLDGRPRRRIELPEGARIGVPSWSPGGTWFAFTRDLTDGVELWVVEVAKGQARAIPGLRIVDILDRGFAWLDNDRLLVHRVPVGRGAAPAPPDAPSGPNIEETSGRVAMVPTFQDLLRSPRDEELFRYYATSQLARVDASTGAVTPLGEPGLITTAGPSPDGKYLLTTRLKEPFSYRVPYFWFARSIEVLGSDGRPVRVLADLPVSDDTPRQGVTRGPREVEWQPLVDARLVWAEALDGGDPTRKVPHRDQVMSLAAPFEDEPSRILEVQHRFIGVSWAAQLGLAWDGSGFGTDGTRRSASGVPVTAVAALCFGSWQP